MRLVIVSVIYLEPEWQETKKCIEAAGLPVIYVDRKGIGSLAKAYNDGFKQAKELKPEYIWFVSNVTFDKDLHERLLKNIGSHSAIHPKFKSDHIHMRDGKGVQPVPFIEFTAPIVRADVYEKFLLDENCPYWGHDLIFGYEANKAGYTLAVDYDNEVGHVYIRHSKPNTVTRQRLINRRNTDATTRHYLAKKYGNEWRDIIFPKTEKDIVEFYQRVNKMINRQMAKVICMDLDGVLTDGKVWVNHKGEIIKGFNSKDLTAIKELISKGYEVHIVTASSWEGAESYLRKSGAILHIIRNKEEIPFNFDIAVGDSAWDIPMFKRAKESFCPADAPLEIRTLDGMNVMETKGGEGVVLELVKFLNG